MCYAYRGREASEPLCEHLRGVYEEAKRRWETRAVAGKVARLCGIDEGLAREAILLSALLHDIGKAAEPLQERCEGGACERWPQHYLISAHWAYVVLSRCLGISDSLTEYLGRVLASGSGGDQTRNLALLVLIPVAFHHYHQVRGDVSYEYRYERGNLRVHASCHGCFAELGQLVDAEFGELPRLCRGRPGGAIGGLPGLLQSLGPEEEARSVIFVRNLGRTMLERSVSPTGFALALEAVTGIVNLCDGLVAASARRPRA